MPDTNHPPYGSQTQQPKQLIRWLDVNAQNGPLGRTQTYITLPPFQYNVNYLGYSDIVLAFNFEGPNNFSLKTFTSLIPANPNYTLCISWFDAQGNSVRYSLWRSKNDNFYFQLTPYAGQLIKKNFRLEVWSAGNVVSDTNTYNFYTSVLGQVDYRYGVDSVLVNSDVAITAFSCSTVNLPNDVNPVATDWWKPSGIVAHNNWPPTTGTGNYTDTVGDATVVSVKGINGMQQLNYTHQLDFSLDPIANLYFIFQGSPFIQFYKVGGILLLKISVTNNVLTIIDGNNVTASCPFTGDLIAGVYMNVNGNTLTVTVYNAAGVQVGTCSIISAVWNDVDNLNAPCVSGVTAIFEVINTAAPFNFQQHLQHNYSSGFALPLTFPNNASSVTN